MDNSTFPCPSASSLYTLMDDHDPNIIYSAGWSLAGTPGFECQTTATGSEPGNTGTARLHFSGVGVEVYGTVDVPDGSPKSTYQVDDLPASLFSFSANDRPNYRMQFYASPLLSPGNHTLLITALGNNGSRVWLDYILYYPSINQPRSATDSKAPSDVAIVGGVLGGIVGILLVLIFAYIVLRRKGKYPSNHEIIDEFVYNPNIPARSTYASDGSTTESRAGTPKWIPTIPRYSVYTRSQAGSGQSQGQS
ncbi:hypothetical protein BDP27DRAFT_1416605 [Rhodocollybia butyracea]|uniref:Uncharacterized protein n=1 Tax=Rhodocollybia butyracea TaxID=206335 RepID=A0A9P5UD68_9AGAR|nr:hypothetical protein BDP27DRAFT_1416605 [Rhodocollybia butyracea]